MQCRICGYRLWNLSARRCPECGTGFLPSEYEFVPGSVRYSCKHCEQTYYGTDARGHLVPAEFVCVKCNRHVCMDEMILHPTAGLQEEQTRIDVVPWLERSEYGYVKAWFTMLGRALFGQTRLMRALPPYSSVLPAWGFSLITQFVIYTFILFPFILLVGYVASSAAATPILGGIFGGGFVALLAAVVAGNILWGLITHAILRLTGTTASTIGRTYQAICYSSGAIVVSGIPCIGMYLLWAGWIWWTVSAILMVKEGQKVHGGRATLAVLTTPVLVIVLAFVVAIMARSRLNFPSPANARISALASSQTVGVVSALHMYATSNADQWPAHAADLIASNNISASEFFTGVNAGSEVPIGDTTLSRLELLSDERQQTAVQAAAAGLPKNIVAHRVGDFVFTYHGVPRTDLMKPFWLVIFWPENKTVAQSATGPIVVGLLNGSITTYQPAEFGQRLAEQNKLRASVDLRPLIPPSLVAHTQPADADAY